MFQKHKQSGFHQFQMVLAYTVFKLVFLINLLGLRVAIDLDTQVVAILLPVHLAVSHIEEVFDAEFLTTWHLNEGHPSGDILLFRHPISNDVIRGRPREIPVIRKCNVFNQYIHCHWKAFMHTNLSHFALKYNLT